MFFRVCAEIFLKVPHKNVVERTRFLLRDLVRKHCANDPCKAFSTDVPKITETLHRKMVNARPTRQHGPLTFYRKKNAGNSQCQHVHGCTRLLLHIFPKVLNNICAASMFDILVRKYSRWSVHSKKMCFNHFLNIVEPKFQHMLDSRPQDVATHHTNKNI